MPLARGVPWALHPVAGAGPATPSGPSRATRNRLASNKRPLAILAGAGRKTISRKLSGERIQASRPRCEVHVKAEAAVQVACWRSKVGPELGCLLPSLRYGVYIEAQNESDHPEAKAETQGADQAA